MGWREGLANMFDYIGQYAGTQGLLKQKAKLSAEEEQQKLMKDFLEYNVWTNPEDPVRRLLAARKTKEGLPLYPNLPLMSKIRPEQFLRLKAPGLGGGGGGFNFFGGGGGDGITEAPSNWDKR